MKRGMAHEKSPVLEAARQACNDEAKAVAFLEARRWGDAPSCPRCDSAEVYQMRDAKSGERNQDFRWRCRSCERAFTVRTGTVFEETRLPLRCWVYAFWKACSSKKGVSALQISRECEISYRSALFLMHRVRHALAEPDPKAKLTGTVEADETYCGGKPRYLGVEKRGRGTKKTPVFAMVQRGGNVRMRVVDRVTSKALGAELRRHVDENARLMTDEWQVYRKLGREFGGGHETVNHGRREYVRGDAHSNTVEGVFSLLKRGLYGTFHSVSRRHLPRYLAEFEFRWNTRHLSDAERLGTAVKAADGKRLTYYDVPDANAA